MTYRNLISMRGAITLMIALVAVALAVLPTSAATEKVGDAPKLIASTESDWPQWRGPRRDAISTETGLLDSWSVGGPKLIWKIAGMGKGWCSPIITGGRIYIVGDVGSELRIFALGLDGAIKWQAPNGKAWKKAYAGGRAACCYSEGKIYHMNGHGRVVCLDAADGKEQWAVNVLKRFEAKQQTFGMSECLLVDGKNVIVTLGGAKVLIAALDKTTGETVWKGAAPSKDAERAGYASPILVNWGGRRIIIANSSFRTFAADAASGKVLWTDGLALTKYAGSTIPVLCDDNLVFITNASFDKESTSMLRVSKAGDKASKIWTVPLRTVCGSSVHVNGNIYVAGGKGQGDEGIKGFFCLDAKTGKVKAKLRKPIDASMVFADGKLFVQSATGKVLLLKPGGDSFKTLGSFSLVRIKGKKKDAWAHPVLLDGRLYLRYHDTLFCYDVKGK
jgi:outer membrane protein assembly factor BamB